jgi:hypothetical protein
MIDRRTALKGGAVGLAALGLSGLAPIAAAEPKNNKTDGSVDGTVIHPSKLLINSPGNLTAVETNIGREFAAVFRHGPLALQINDDTAAHGQYGYSNSIQFLTQGGGRIATINGDVSEHIGFYTAATDVTATGTDVQPAKRMNIQGGVPLTTVDVYDMGYMNLRGQTGAPGQEVLLQFLAEDTNQDMGWQAKDSAGNFVAKSFYDASRGDVRIQNYQHATPDFLELKSSGEIDINQHPIVGQTDIPGATAGDLQNGQIATDSTNGRLVWKDNTGSAYYVSGTPL